MKRGNSCAELYVIALLSEHAAIYANGVLSDLGCDVVVDEYSDHPAIAWKRSGLLQTTGLMHPLPLASHADGALMALKAISSNSNLLPKTGALLLGERARLIGLKQSGHKNASSYARLIKARDGRLALNLARQEGLAVAKDEFPSEARDWVSFQKFEKRYCQKPLVVDLSSLWAGPLGSSLLSMTGANVIKIESPNRPDGTRAGHRGFYDLLNAGKFCVSLDFCKDSDFQALIRILERADVVIEASRPRVFQQMGIIAEDFVARKPGKIWARLTAYGQGENRVGFGDDIGVSAGLCSVMEAVHGQACFVGDAIADPLSGIHLALAIQADNPNGALQNKP